MAEFTFHGHAEVGAEMADEVLLRLAVLGRRDREEVVALVADHMRAHAFAETSRKKLAKVLRAPHAPRLLKLLEADSLGKVPQANEDLARNLAVAEKFFAEDRLLRDLGINARLLMQLGQEPGRALGVKLASMQARLDKNPNLSRENLLKGVGLQENGG